MATLVVSVDRDGGIYRDAGVETPIVSEDAVARLVTEIGVADPEDSEVNCLLEALRVTRDIASEGEETTVAAVSGAGDSAVGSDRAIARAIDDLVAEHSPDAVIVVLDSAEDERVVPIIESRVRVDSVDRVVVRQAHDLESSYYLLKQFLGDEEFRESVLVPIGLALLTFPIIVTVAGIAAAFATITAVIGGFLLYKGLGIDERVEDIPVQARDAFYSGRVSIVTYVVAGGLALVGLFAGALEVTSPVEETGDVIISVMTFVYHSVPWIALAALTASTGRLFDEAIRSEELSSAYLNLPFGALATGIVVRGFSAYFLQRAEPPRIAPVVVPSLEAGVVSVSSFALSPTERLAVFVVAGVLVSLVGFRVAARISGTSLPEPELADSER
jgi:putative membrane protein